jgi:excisionase family DNA binding protein
VTQRLQEPSSGPRFLSVQDVVKDLGISASTVHKLIQSGQLVAANVGLGGKANWKIDRADYETYLEQARAKTVTRFTS